MIKYKWHKLANFVKNVLLENQFMSGQFEISLTEIPNYINNNIIINFIKLIINYLFFI